MQGLRWPRACDFSPADLRDITSMQDGSGAEAFSIAAATWPLAASLAIVFWSKLRAALVLVRA
jgi:hypothetical protein